MKKLLTVLSVLMMATTFVFASGSKETSSTSQKVELTNYTFGGSSTVAPIANAAIAGFENFLQEHIGSKLKEDALYYKFKASNDLAINSVIQKKEKRINDAFAVHDKFLKKYPESNKIKELASMHKNLDKQLKDIKEQIQNFKNNTNNGL